MSASKEQEQEKFEFLAKRALELGASGAKIIPSSKVVIEDRVVLKCKVGCNNYGKTLACPPFTPSVNEFRKIISEYSYVMFMKFTSKAEADTQTQKAISKMGAGLTEDEKVLVDKFWALWKKDKIDMLTSVVQLEKEAMRAGYSLAVGFVSGNCQLCDKCNTETRICAHPELARMSEDAVGVNVKKTAQNAGLEYIYPYPKNPESFALLLID